MQANFVAPWIQIIKWIPRRTIVKISPLVHKFAQFHAIKTCPDCKDLRYCWKWFLNVTRYSSYILQMMCMGQICIFLCEIFSGFSGLVAPAFQNSIEKSQFWLKNINGNDFYIVYRENIYNNLNRNFSHEIRSKYSKKMSSTFIGLCIVLNLYFRWFLNNLRTRKQNFILKLYFKNKMAIVMFKRTIIKIIPHYQYT